MSCLTQLHVVLREQSPSRLPDVSLNEALYTPMSQRLVCCLSPNCRPVCCYDTKVMCNHGAGLYPVCTFVLVIWIHFHPAPKPSVAPYGTICPSIMYIASYHTCGHTTRMSPLFLILFWIQIIVHRARAYLFLRPSFHKLAIKLHTFCVLSLSRSLSMQNNAHFLLLLYLPILPYTISNTLGSRAFASSSQRTTFGVDKQFNKTAPGFTPKTLQTCVNLMY